MPDVSQLPEGYDPPMQSDRTYFQGVYDGARSTEGSLTAKITVSHREAYETQVRLSCDNQLLEATLHMGRVQAFKEVLDIIAPPPDPTPGVKSIEMSDKTSYIKLLDLFEASGKRQLERAAAAEKQLDEVRTELQRVRDEMREDAEELREDNEQAVNHLRTARRWIERAEQKLDPE